jgi:hypothetical protein
MYPAARRIPEALAPFGPNPPNSPNAFWNPCREKSNAGNDAEHEQCDCLQSVQRHLDLLSGDFIQYRPGKALPAFGIVAGLKDNEKCH